jgi:hypothetical protein
VTFDFPGGLVIGAGYAWAATSNPPIFDGDEIKRFKDNSPYLEATYAFADRYSIGLNYRHNHVRFDQEPWDLDDNNMDDLYLDLNYRILPKTTVFLRGGWAQEEFINRDFSDSHTYNVWMGARTTPGAKIVGVLAGGYSRREFEDEQAGDPVNAFTVQGDLYYHLTPRTRLTFQVLREISPTYVSTQENEIYGSSYVGTRIRAGVEQAFTHRLTASAYLGYGLWSYSGEGPRTEVSDREDTAFDIELGLEYRVWKYIGLGLSYNLLDNNSSVGDEDYTENRVTFSLAFRL